MRNGTKKTAAIVGSVVVAAALGGAGYWQGVRAARILTDDSTAKTTQDEEKMPVLTIARDLLIKENSAIPTLDGRCEARLETSATEIPLGDAVYCRFVERNVATDGTPVMLMDYNAPFFGEEMAQSANFSI